MSVLNIGSYIVSIIGWSDYSIFASKHPFTLDERAEDKSFLVHLQKLWYPLTFGWLFYIFILYGYWSVDYYLLLHPPIPFLYHYIRKTIWCSPRSKVYAFKFLWINYHSAEFEPIFKLLKTFSKLHFHFMVLLKSDSHLPKKCVSFAWLKALFGHVRKNGLIRKIRLTSKFMTSQTGLQIIAIYIAQYLTK